MNIHPDTLKLLSEQLQILEGIQSKPCPFRSQNKNNMAAREFAEFLLICQNEQEAACRANLDELGLFSFLEVARRLLVSISDGKLSPKTAEADKQFPYALIASVVIWFLDGCSTR